MSGTRWYAFECFQHHDTSASGLVFDMRLSDDVQAPTSARCPHCGSECRVDGSWPGDDGGYGSGGHPVRAAERRHAELMVRLDRIARALSES